MIHDAWCSAAHDRTGLVTNQPGDDYDKGRPLVMVAVCSLPRCVAKGIRYVAGETHETAVHTLDADRRAAKAVTS